MGELQAIPRHPKKEVESALAEMRAAGWTGRRGGGHCWAVVVCPYDHPCRASVSGTPRNPAREAGRLRRVLGQCPGG